MADKSIVEVNVMMFGGRRCGKTSVIAAMKKCMEDQFGKDSPLVISCDSSTFDVIDKKEQEISEFLNAGRATFIPDAEPTLDEQEYRFDLSIKGKNGCVTLDFYDYPGEWLDRKDKETTLIEHVNNSNIFIVAIDSPMLMEDPDSTDDKKIGRYNEATNKSKKICNTLKNALAKREEIKEPLLVMFVPLKCEKYANQGRMHELWLKVQAAYKTLFDYFGGENSRNFEVVIAPILTFGAKTAEFSRFDNDDDGNIIVNDFGIPARPIYRRINEEPYSPKYCEMPALWSLKYILALAKTDRYEKATPYKKTLFNVFFKIPVSKLFNALLESFKNLPGYEEFKNMEDDIDRMLKPANYPGYGIIQDPLDI